MPYVLSAIIVVLLTILIVSRRKRRSAVSDEATTHTGHAIPVTAEMLEKERQDNDEVMRLLEASIRASGLFRAAKIPELVSKLRGGSSPFARVNTKIAFDGDKCLSVEEKRALGLNTRMKYSKAFIEYFDPTTLKTTEPKSVLEDMHLNAFYRVARKRDLVNFRELGFVKHVKIVPVGDARDCNEIKRFKKIHDLNRVPDLPLPGCTSPYCRCMHEPILSDP
jgi:hypothetical protein